MFDKEIRLEEEFKRKRDRLFEIRDMQLEAQTQVRLFEHRETQALDDACDILGLPKVSSHGQKFNDHELRIMIDLRRMFSERYIIGPKV